MRRFIAAAGSIGLLLCSLIPATQALETKPENSMQEKTFGQDEQFQLQNHSGTPFDITALEQSFGFGEQGSP